MPGPVEKHINAFARYCLFLLGIVLVGTGVYGLIDFDRREAVVGNLLWITAIVGGVFAVRIARPINLFWTGDSDHQEPPAAEPSSRQKSMWRLIKILMGALLVSLVFMLIGSRLSSGEGSAGALLFDVFGALALVIMVATYVVWHFLIDHDGQ